MIRLRRIVALLIEARIPTIDSSIVESSILAPPARIVWLNRQPLKLEPGR
jgi:hypothetical protein